MYNTCTLPTNCVESPYPMATSTHRIRIELENHNFEAKLLFLWLTYTKKDYNVALLKENW